MIKSVRRLEAVPDVDEQPALDDLGGALAELLFEQPGKICLWLGYGGHHQPKTDGTSAYQFDSQREYFLDDWAAARAALDERLTGRERIDAYWCPAARATRSRKQGTSAAELAVLWADLDGPAADEALLDKLDPFRVASGTESHQHVYVPLGEYVPVAVHQALNKALARALGGDHKWPENSLLRGPGTLNHKHDPPAPVELLSGGGRAWDVDELAALLGVDVTALESTAPESTTPAVAVVVTEPVPDPLPARVRSALTHPDVHDKSAAHHRLVTACRDAGLTVGQAHTIAAGYGPSVEKYGPRLPDEVARSYGKFGEHIPGGTTIARGAAATEAATADEGPYSRQGASAGDRQDDEPDDELDAAKAADDAALRKLAVELGSVARAKAELIERARVEARQRIAQDAARPLSRRSVLDLLAEPELDYLVPRLIYPDSLFRVYGPPGAGKSYVFLDLVLSLAAGAPWFGHGLGRHRVHYIAAEGSKVNTRRMRSWLAHRGVDPVQIEGWFVPYDEAVLLTPEGVRDYLVDVEADEPAVVVLDTKNAMMVGEENSASDVAVMVRAMHAIRLASGAAVGLVDHTGLVDLTRGRGSNAVQAAMDTEILVMPGVATVTRDKAAEAGHEVRYRFELVRGYKDPVIAPDERPQAVREPLDGADWNDPLGWPLPEDVLSLRGHGSAAVPFVAMFMRRDAGTDVRAVGRSRAEVVKYVCPVAKVQQRAAERAWDLLHDNGRLALVDGVQAKTGRSVWVKKPTDPPG